jgi:hypothetical protein
MMLDPNDVLRGAVLSSFGLTAAMIAFALVYYRLLRPKLRDAPDKVAKTQTRTLAILCYIHLGAALWFFVTFVVRFEAGLAKYEGEPVQLLALINYIVAYGVLIAPSSALIWALYHLEANLETETKERT